MALFYPKELLEWKPNKMMKKTTDRSVDRSMPYNKSARPKLNGTVNRENGLGTGVRQRPAVDVTHVNMNVYVRVRPFNSRETASGCRRVTAVEKGKYIVFDPKEDDELFYFKGSAQKGRDINKRVNKNMLFEFNRVFGEESTNEEVFEDTAKTIVKSVLEGYNCSVFAYGATGAGKTFTMLGSSENPGITYRTIVELLDQVEHLEGKITLGASYIEVYNENVRDLIHPETGMLQLREEANRVIVAGLRVETIRSSDQLFALLAEGNRNRSQHPTDSNAESSRSHAVFQVHVQMEVSTNVKVSKLSMIDLAGSERGAATGCKGIRFKEGSNINKSLLALGNCINALADGHRHVPYRDSKLTRLLKDSLGGNCRTIMIANVSPSSLSFEDTYNTLKYAARAKTIKSKVSKNQITEKISPAQYTKVVDELKQLRQLLSKYEAAPTVTNNVLTVPNLEDWEAKIANVFEEKKALQMEMLKLQSEERLTEWRLKHKCNALNNQDALEDETTSRTQIGIDQLRGRLETFRKRLDEYKPRLVANVEREESLEKEIRAHPQIAPILLDKLEIYRYKVLNEIKDTNCKHQLKIAQLQGKMEESHAAALTDLASVSNEMFSLLRSYGHLNKDLEVRFQSALKTVDGLKAVSFAEDVTSPQHKKLLRLSMGPVRDKPVVTEEEMNNYMRTINTSIVPCYPLKERSQNRVNAALMITKNPLPRTPLKAFKGFNFNTSCNKENGVSPAPLKFPLPGTPGNNGGAALKAIRSTLNSSRTLPHGSLNRVKKTGVLKPTPKPIRMNKLAAARMAASVSVR